MEGKSSGAAQPAAASFASRHQFLIYRLFSLAGLLPVGGYMVIHLLTNATILNGVAVYQEQVNRIHALGVVLPLVEWTFIFLPLLFHGIVGWLIISGAVPNTSSYPYSGNFRYTLQRITGIIAFCYIVYHVWQLHHMGALLGGGLFRPEHASSSAAAVLEHSLWVQLVYAIGVLSCVYHFANGIWTAGITWGVWVSRRAQRRANYVTGFIGLALAAVGLSALWGMTRVDIAAAVVIEDRVEAVQRMIEGKAPLEGAAVPHPVQTPAAAGTSGKSAAN